MIRTSHEDDERLETDVTIRPQFRQSMSYWDMKKNTVVQAIEWADVVVLERMAEAEGIRLIEMCAQKGKPCVHEVDDMCEMVIPGNPAYWYWKDIPRLERHAECFRKSAMVTTTNPRLARFYKDTYKKPVAVLPNSIDYGSGRWKDTDFTKGPGVTVGWMASESHKVDEEQVKEVIPRMLKEFPEVRMEFCGYMPPWAEGLPRTTRVQGDIMSVPKLIQGWDIGICPIIDHPFNTIGKSDIKFLEYSTVFCATVAPRLQPYVDSIQDGENGMLVDHDKPDSWLAAIEKLVKRPSLRNYIADSSHSYLKRARIMHLNVHLWFKTYAALLTGTKPLDVEIL